jgi:hypothetical protein
VLPIYIKHTLETPKVVLTGLLLAERVTHTLIRLKRIYNFLCSMLVYAPFSLCFVTLRGVFMHFPELTY